VAIKVFLDQGHNPRNPNAGAEGNGYREQDLMFTIGIMCANLLNANPDFAALVSRPTTGTVLGASNSESLAERVRLAVNWGADVFISLHANASEITSASGSEGYIYSDISSAKPICESILENISYATGLQNRGIFIRPTLYVLRRTPMPSMLLELGFITNANDAYLMANEPDLFARGIYNGLVAYYQ